jgi:hypothetical protein
VILLSELNTVVKNHEASLAWWLKQIEQLQPDQKGDRVVSLQSVSTHQKDLYTIQIKKGTLIVVDVNTKDYQGRMALPGHFVSENRIEMRPLITDTEDKIIIDSELEVLAKYI